MAKLRSPNYPSLALSEAIARTERLFKKDRQIPVPDDVAAKDIGYTGLTGPSRSALSALKKFGLLDDAGPGMVKVSDLALRILHPSSDGERDLAVRDAALRPELFRELWETFGESGSDVALHSFLIRRQFSEDGARAAMRTFRSTAEYANLAQLGYNETQPTVEAEPMPQPSTIDQRIASNLTPESGIIFNADSYTASLKGGRKVELKVVGGKLRKADIESLKGWLDWQATQLDDDEDAPEPFSNN